MKLTKINILTFSKKHKKNNLKRAEDQIVQSIVLATRTRHTLLPGLKSTLLLGVVVI